MRFEEALKGMRSGKKATFGKSTGQTAEGIVSRQHKLGVNWVLSCDWRFVDD